MLRGFQIKRFFGAASVTALALWATSCIWAPFWPPYGYATGYVQGPPGLWHREAEGAWSLE